MKTFLLSCIFLTFSSGALAQQSDKILGTWLTEDKDGKIEVFKKGDQYFGKIIWIKNNTNKDGSSPKLDINNPDEDKRSTPIIGTIILKKLEWDSDDQEWDDGEIYDPKSGNTYDVYAKLESENRLYLKGYIGISLLGRSTYWTRVE